MGAPGLRRHLAPLLQTATEARARRLCPRRVVFLHIPKTAGSSVNAYFKGRLGASWYGQAITVTDALMADPAARALAGRARFVGGHFGAETLAAIRGAAFAFTVLRDPMERLVSAWRFFQSHRRAELRLPYPTLEAALASGDPRVAAAFDNVIARALGAGVGDDAQAIVARAAETLASLDHVAWQVSFDADFAAILAELGLPTPAVPIRRNVTDDPARANRKPGEALATVPPADELDEIAGAHVALDRAAIALWLKNTPLTPGGA